MKMKLKWLQALGLLLLLQTSLSFGKEDRLFETGNRDFSVSYMGTFSLNNMHCLYRINDLLYTTSTLLLQPGWEPEGIVYSDDIGGLLQEGDNKLELIAIQIPKVMTNGSSSYCELTVTATATNWDTGDVESKEVTHLRASINGEGKFTAEESHQYPEPSVTDSVQFVELDQKEFEVDWVNNDVSLTRNLRINHPHRAFGWTQAEPFEETPENIARLWQVYEEFIEAFTNHDTQKLEKLLLPAAKERDIYTGYAGRGSRRMTEMMVVFNSGWSRRGFTHIPEPKSDFRLERANHGKLFRLNLGYLFDVSPLKYVVDDDYGTYNFYFTEIDGKIRVGIL
ncbi:hypothetical protein [Ignatzschineria sp. LJL83]